MRDDIECWIFHLISQWAFHWKVWNAEPKGSSDNSLVQIPWIAWNSEARKQQETVKSTWYLIDPKMLNWKKNFFKYFRWWINDCFFILICNTA